MIPTLDLWYVRLPDGRIYRAKSTKAVQRRVREGRLPAESHVRRSPDEEWQSIEWTQEFAPLVRKAVSANRSKKQRIPKTSPPAKLRTRTVAARLDLASLRTFGVGSFAEELTAALDVTFSQKKMLVAAATTVLAGVFLVLMQNLGELFDGWTLIHTNGAAALFFTLIGAFACALLTRMTYIEVSRMRPVNWQESGTGWVRSSFKLLVGLLSVVGVVLLVQAALRWLPTWILTSQDLTWSEVLRRNLAAVVASAALVLEVFLWPVLVFALLLAPIIVVEEEPITRAFGTWWRLIQQHTSRTFVFQALAAAVAGAITVPFALPVLAGRLTAPADGALAAPLQATLTILICLAATPFLAYLAVANVFIYLNLRYETPQK